MALATVSPPAHPRHPPSLEQTVLDAVRVHGALSLWGLRQQTGIRRRTLASIVDRLVDQGKLKRLPVDGDLFHFLSTPPLCQCTCDGRCLEQIVVLSRPEPRRIFTLLHRHAAADPSTLATTAPQVLGCDERTQRRHLRSLVDADLVERRRDERDNRRTLYHARPLDPVVQAAIPIR